MPGDKRKKISDYNNNYDLSKKLKPTPQKPPQTINDLPEEIILVILKMSYYDINKASLVCKLWNSIVQKLYTRRLFEKYRVRFEPTPKSLFFTLKQNQFFQNETLNSIAEALWSAFRRFSKNSNIKRHQWSSESKLISRILGDYYLSEIIEKLIQRERNLSKAHRDKYNLTVLHYFGMLIQPYDSAVELLIKQGFDINTKTSYELTPIEIRVAANNMPEAQLSTYNIRSLINKETKVNYIFDWDEDAYGYDTTLGSYGEEIRHSFQVHKSYLHVTRSIIDHCAAIAILACNYTGDYQTSLRNSDYPDELITLIGTIKEKANGDIDEIFARVSNLEKILTTTSDLYEAVAQMMGVQIDNNNNNVSQISSCKI